MLVSLLAITVIAQEPSPAKLLSEMFAKYASAKTVSGTITLTQGTERETGQIVTELAYERPAKLFIRQVRATQSRRVWLVTSDGKYFSYGKPDPTVGGRLVEPVSNEKRTLDLGGIYAAASASLGDRSAPLDIAISRREDLAAVRAQLATLDYVGTKDLGGETVHVIEGKWREYGEAPATGKFTICIGPNSDLRVYAVTEPMSIGGAVLNVLSRWDVNLKVGADIGANVFKVVL